MLLNKTKTISITSGKGGVGKTLITANLAVSLALQGKRVLILDADLGMANIDIAFGVKADKHLGQLFNEESQFVHSNHNSGHDESQFDAELTVEDLIVPLMPNVSLLSGASGLVEMNRINSAQRRAIMDSIGSLEYHFDYLLIDTAPGITDNVLYFNAAAQLSVVVITNDPTSLADSYALIKTMNKEYKESRFAIVCNNVRDEQEGLILYQRFSDVVSKFLYIGLDYVGCIFLPVTVS